MLPHVGIARPVKDFVGASVTFSALIRFLGKIPEKFDTPYSIATMLYIKSNFVVELNDVDEAGNAVISSYPVWDKTVEFCLNTSSVISPLNTMVAGPAEMFIPDAVGESSSPAAPPADPTLNFGDAKLFNEYVIAQASEQNRDMMIKLLKNIDQFFRAEHEYNKMKAAPTLIGDDAKPANSNMPRMEELEAIMVNHRAMHEKRCASVKDFMERTYLVLTTDGFVPTRPAYMVVSKDNKKQNTVVPIEPMEFRNNVFTKTVFNFLSEHVSKSDKIKSDITFFMEDSMEAVKDSFTFI